MIVREMERRVKAEQRTSALVSSRLHSLGQRLDQMLDGPLWAELTGEEKSVLSEAAVALKRLAEGRRGTR